MHLLTVWRLYVSTGMLRAHIGILFATVYIMFEKPFGIGH